MFQIDPETKSKLVALQKQPPNSICADCSSPSPQWASPKFGTFICLECAGVHRGMGVHVSFVRSVMMDSFKVSEVKRMELGGNEAWQSFWDNHPEGGGKGDKGIWNGVVTERYDSYVGEEYKERLACKVEEREYVPIARKEKKPVVAAAGGAGSGASTPMGGRGSPAPAAGGRTGSSALGGMRKERNEAYFAKMGAENAGRSEDLPPNQGGKYAGFGSGFVPQGAGRGVGGQGIPGADEFQKDPMAALSRGFGWFTTTVGKGARTVNEGYIQPSVQKLAETDLAAQARVTAANVAQNVQKGTKTAADSLNTSFQRFVEGGADGPQGSKSPVDPEKKDFWDSFGGNTARPAGSSMLAGAASTTTTGGKKESSIGTSAMKTGIGGGEKKEDWGEENW